MDEHIKAKKKIVELFFEEYGRRWQNIKQIQAIFPSEALVLAYCFVEAMGYYRYGFSGSKLSSTEQFIKILYDYQSNRHFFVIPPQVIAGLPLDYKRRTIGREINSVVLQWLKDTYSSSVGMEIAQIWDEMPKEVLAKLSLTEVRRRAHLYQVCWAGWDYDAIRTAGVHKAHFPKRLDEKAWEEIVNAGEEVLENLRSECLEKIKFPHQLLQSDEVFKASIDILIVMKIMVFTEGTLTMASCGEGVSRKERVKQVAEGLPEVDDFSTYLPVGNAVDKLKTWVRQGAEICYLTSRRKVEEIEQVRNTLKKYGFPEGVLYYREGDESYSDVAERVKPDILIEDDCESIGGEVEMTYPHIDPKKRELIKSIVIKEFAGIDNLPDRLEKLASYDAKQ